MALNANDNQLDYPIIYASAKEGWATQDLVNGDRNNIFPLLDIILSDVPSPSVNRDDKFSMVVTVCTQILKCYIFRFLSFLLLSYFFSFPSFFIYLFICFFIFFLHI